MNTTTYIIKNPIARMFDDRCANELAFNLITQQENGESVQSIRCYYKPSLKNIFTNEKSLGTEVLAPHHVIQALQHLCDHAGAIFCNDGYEIEQIRVKNL